MSRAPKHRWRRADALSEDIYELVRGARVLIIVQKNDAGEWYWYGLERNTVRSPVATLDIAKKNAEAHAASVFRVVDKTLEGAR